MTCPLLWFLLVVPLPLSSWFSVTLHMDVEFMDTFMSKFPFKRLRTLFIYSITVQTQAEHGMIFFKRCFHRYVFSIGKNALVFLSFSLKFSIIKMHGWVFFGGVVFLLLFFSYYLLFSLQFS